MRLAFLLLLALPLVAAQPSLSSAEASLEDVPSLTTGSGSLLIPIEVRLDVVGMTCASDTQFAVPISVEVVADNDTAANVTVQWQPEVASFLIPAGSTLGVPYSQTRTVTLVADGPANATAEFIVQAAEPSGTCTALGTEVRSGDQATVAVAWDDEQTNDEPAAVDQIMPGPAIPALILGLILTIFMSRHRFRGNGPK